RLLAELVDNNLYGVRRLNLWLTAAEADSFAGPELALPEQTVARIADDLRCYLQSIDEHGLIQADRHGIYQLEIESGLCQVHHIVRHSYCPICARRVAPLRAGDRARLEGEQARVVARWQEILAHDPESLPPEPAMVRKYQDPVTGLLNHSEEWSRRAGYFRNIPELWGGPRLVRDGEYFSARQGINGTGPSLEHRRLICISEGAERYGQYTHRPALESVAFKDLDGFAFDPREISLYQEEQYALPGFPRPRFDPDLPLNWSWGYGLVSGQARLFPVELITMYLSDFSYPNRLVTQPLSSGGASHASYRRALLNGLRELIERDAHMIAWYKQIPLRRVRLPKRVGDPFADDLLAFLDGVGLDFRVFDMMLDFPMPTFLTVGRMRENRGNMEKGGLVFVATADLGKVAALSRGLCETAIHYETLCLNPDYSKDYHNFPYNQDDPDQGWDNWWPTYLHYLNPVNAALVEANFFDTTDEVPFEEIADRSTGDPVTDLDWLLQRFAERRLEPYAWDLVTDEIAELQFRVAKVVVPGLIPLTAGFQSRRLSSPRLEQVAAALGRSSLPPGQTCQRSHPNA
ncbi:MAG: YcaO-like family protein, partial [Deltaproteobacteria bacterium]|nr:YcaO-like family protein [Deltaproteobacteria bacterium]